MAYCFSVCTQALSTAREPRRGHVPLPFPLTSLSAPEHATATSVVILAIDTFVPEESDEGVEETKGADSPALSRNVVIKLMKEKEVSDREIAQRKGTNPKHVVVGRGRAL